MPSNPTTINDIFISGKGDATTLDVCVSGDGDYKYSKDGETCSNNNIIENIRSGSVTVTVRDKMDVAKFRNWSRSSVILNSLPRTAMP